MYMYPPSLVALGMIMPHLRPAPSSGALPETPAMPLLLVEPGFGVLDGQRDRRGAGERCLAYQLHSARLGLGRRCLAAMLAPDPPSGVVLREATPEMLADVALLRTKIFYPEMLESPYNKYLQAKTFVEQRVESVLSLAASQIGSPASSGRSAWR